MPERSVLLTSKLTSREISLARKERVNLIVYEDFDPLAAKLPEDIESRQVTMAMHPDLFMQWKARAREDVETFCDSKRQLLSAPLVECGIDEDSAFDFIVQSISRYVQEDYRLVLFGRNLFPNQRTIYVLTDAALVKQIAGLTETVQSSGSHARREVLKHLLMPLYALISSAKAWLFGKRGRQSTQLVFDQAYPFYEGNNEFGYFYRWLRTRPWKVAYLVESRDWELASVLTQHGQPLVARGELKLKPRAVTAFAFAWVRLLFWIIRSSLPISATSQFGLLLFHFIRSSALIETCDFQFYMKMRGDVDLYSAALRRLFNSHGIRMIGYSHGTFFARGPLWSRVHADFYGYSGQNELKSFQGTLMPAGVQYIHAGQMSVENPVDESRIEEIREVYRDRGIGIFPTTVSPHELALTETNLLDFVRVSVRCAARYSRDRIIFKDKNVGGRVLEELQLAEKEFGVQILKAHHADSHYQKKLSAVETYQLIDFGLAFSATTCAFELLALQKRVLVYEPLRNTRHPFERYTPLLIAHEPSEFEDQFDKLSRMSDADYKAYIRPAIEFCSKKADGKLVQNFLQSVPGLDPSVADAASLVTVHT
jgi:hypothetical protein